MKHQVADVMTKVVVAAAPATGYKEILARMTEFRVSALPVIDEDGVILGIVSEADLLLKEELGPDGGTSHLFESAHQRDERHKARGSTAEALMTAPAMTIRPNVSIVLAARLMHVKGVKRLPVVDGDGHVLGIVSRADLLKVFRRDDDAIRKEIEEELLDRTLWLEPGEIEVRVRDGVVLLSGTSERRSLIPILVRLVEGVEGVVAVRSGDLAYDFDDTSISPARSA